GVLWLLEKLADAGGVIGMHIDDTELVGKRYRLADGSHCHPSLRFLVGFDHLAEVHPVDVVGANHDHDVWFLVAQQVEALQDGVCGTREPSLAEALLGGNGCNVGVGEARQPPGLGDVPVEADRKSTRLNSSHVKSSYAVF